MADTEKKDSKHESDDSDTSDPVDAAEVVVHEAEENDESEGSQAAGAREEDAVDTAEVVDETEEIYESEGSQAAGAREEDAVDTAEVVVDETEEIEEGEGSQAAGAREESSRAVANKPPNAEVPPSNAPLSPPPIESESNVHATNNWGVSVAVDRPVAEEAAAATALHGSNSPATSPGILRKVASGLSSVRQKSRDGARAGVSKLKKSASIAAGHSHPEEPPPPYKPNVDLPPNYPGPDDPPPPYPDAPPPPDPDAPPPPFNDGQLPSSTDPDHHDAPALPSDAPPPLPPPAAWAADRPPMAERAKEGMKVLFFLLVAAGIIAAWVCWLAIPLRWVTTGRHHVRDNWDAVNCTVLHQSCYKKCSGCGCPDSCCTGAADCVRSSYFMSQTCVWLSMSKYQQNPDYTARIEINDNIAPSSRLGTQSAMVAAMLAAAGFGLFGWSRSRVLAGVVLLGSVMLVQGANNNDCTCNKSFQVAMTVQFAREIGSPVTLSTNIGCGENDDRSFCRDDEFKYRDKSCRTLEDMELRHYCHLEHLNRNGKTRTCFLNPEDPDELEIAGSKPWGGGTLAAIITWSVFTFFCCCTCVCSS